MTQIQVNYFLKTCETGNIASAAEALFVSRSAISRAISDMERELQAELFARTKTGVVLTEAGRMTYQTLQTIQGCYAGLSERLQLLRHGALTRRIRVGITPTNAIRLYDRYFRDYLREYPGTELSLTEEAASRCMELLSRREIDVAFVPASEKTAGDQDSDLVRVPLYRNRIVLWVNRDSPLAGREELDVYNILDCPLGFLLAPMPMEDALISCFEMYGKKPNVTVRTSSIRLLRQMVLDGQTCAVVPDDLFPPDDKLKAVRLSFFPECNNSMVWNRLDPCSGAVLEFLDFVRAKAE